MNSQNIYKTQNPVLGFFALYLHPARYIEMAVTHNIANELTDPTYQKAYEAGDYHLEDRRNILMSNCEASRDVLKNSIKVSFLRAISISLLALLIAWLLGEISPSLPLASNKLFFAVSACLGVWGATLQLDPKPESYDRNTLAEKIHGIISSVLFVPISIAAILQVMF